MKQFALHSSAAIGFIRLSGHEVLNGANATATVMEGSLVPRAPCS